MAGRHEASKLLVFNYHNIVTEDTPAYASGMHAADFRRQIDWLDTHYELRSLEAAVGACRAGALERPTACITFDDGYRTQAEVAAAYLKDRGIPATFFVTSGHLDGELLWNDWLGIFSDIASEKNWAEFADILEGSAGAAADGLGSVDLKKVEAIFKYLSLDARKPVLDYIRSLVPESYPKQQMMTREDVRGLHADGFTIGAHSLSHPILMKEERQVADEQIAGDVRSLSEIIGRRVRCFAFPNGKPGKDFDADHILMLARNGIEFGLTSAFGHFSAGQDPLQISRVCLRDSSELGFLRSIRQAYSVTPDTIDCRGYEGAG